MKEIFTELFDFTEKPPKASDKLVYLQKMFNSLSKSPVFIAGGSMLSVELGHKPKDVDVWTKNYEGLIFKLRHFFPVEYTTDTATCFRIGNLLVDVCHRSCNTLEEVFSKFDFTCCCIGLDDGVTVVKYPEDIKNRSLKLNNPDPLKLERILRYMNKGFTPDCDLRKSIAEMDIFEEAMKIMGNSI